MRILRLSPESLREAFHKGSFPFSASHFSATLPYTIEKQEVLLLWADDHEHDELPSAFVVDRSEIQSFLAWMVTYIRSLSPLTAYARVLSLEDARRLASMKAQPSLGKMRDSCVGAIIGSQYAMKGRAEPTLLDCVSSTAFATARSLALFGHCSTVETRERLFEARRILGHPPTREDAAEIDVFSVAEGIVSSVDKRVGLLAHACEEIWDSGVIEPGTWRRLTNSHDALAGARDISSLNREERVGVVRPILRTLGDAPELLGPNTPFVSGYLASMVGPGSLEHRGVLEMGPAAGRGALVWYGFLAGRHSGNSVLATAHGLGARINRELCLKEDAGSSIRADVSLHELAVRARGRTSMNEILSISPGILNIEIFPGVVVPFPVHPPAPRAETQQQALLEDESGDWVGLGKALGQAMRIYNAMSSKQGRGTRRRER